MKTKLVTVSANYAIRNLKQLSEMVADGKVIIVIERNGVPEAQLCALPSEVETKQDVDDWAKRSAFSVNDAFGASTTGNVWLEPRKDKKSRLAKNARSVGCEGFK